MKDFDIEEFESSGYVMNEPYIYNVCDDSIGIDGTVNKEWAIATAKNFKLTAEDLK